MRFFSIIELFRSNIISLELTQPEAEILYPMLLPTAQQNDAAALIIGNSVSDWTALKYHFYFKWAPIFQQFSIQ